MRSLILYMTRARFTRLSGCGELMSAMGSMVVAGEEGDVEVGEVEEEDAGCDAVVFPL